MEYNTPRQKLLEQARLSVKHMPSRTAVQLMSCPYCHAAHHMPCIGRRKKVRESNHVERVLAYLDTML